MAFKGVKMTEYEDFFLLIKQLHVRGRDNLITAIPWLATKVTFTAIYIRFFHHDEQAVKSSNQDIMWPKFVETFISVLTRGA